ncbi:MAG: M56 family metallopeptidase [Thermoanaerobaculia bacterium]
MSDLLQSLATWLATYLLHSTVLFGLAWGIDRLRLLASPAMRAQVWRAALVGALVTATAQSAGLAERAPMASLLSFSHLGTAPSKAETDAPRPVEMQRAAGGKARAGGRFEELAAASASGGPEVPIPVTTGPPSTRWPRFLALCWLAGALFLTLRLAALGWRARRDLVGRTTAAAPIRHELATLCRLHGFTVPRLSLTPAIAGPVALPNGEIVLPHWVPDDLDTRQQRAVLAHELAHQVRRDPQWLVLALVLDALLWVQPLHGISRRRIASLAELEADSWAARLLRDPRALAESLAACAERLVAHRVARWSAGMVTCSRHDSPLLHRIDCLLKGTPMSTSQSSWPARAGALVVLGLGTFLLPGCGPAGFGAISGFGGGSSTSITISDDGDTRLAVRRSGYSMKMEYDGEVTFAQDESDIATLSAGGTFFLSEKVAGVAHAYKVKSTASGQLERKFFRDGDELGIDAEGRQWLANALPRMFRESGLDADARVARLLDRGGPEFVFTEVDLAIGDHAKATYLGKLLGTVQLDDAQFDRALACASKFESSFELRTALELALSTQELDGARVVALLATAEQIDSDFELRTVLERVAARGGEPEVATAYLASVRRLESDFERRTALVALLENATLDGVGLAGALDVASGFGSDFEKRSVLEILAKSVATDPDLNRRYRDVARGLGEFERGQALTALDEAARL